MTPFEVFLKSAALPGAACGAVLVIAALVSRRTGNPRLGAVGTGVGVAVAFGTGLALLEGWPSLPLEAGANAWVWVAWFAVGGLVLGVAELFLEPRLAVALPLRVAASLGAMWLLVDPLVKNGALSSSDGWWHAGIAALGTGLLWHAGTVGAGTTVRRDTAPLPLLLTTAGLATTLVLVSGAAIMGQVTGALAAGLGTAHVLGIRLGRPAVGTAGAAVTAMVLGGILLAAYEYLNWEGHVNFPLVSAVLLVGGAVVGIVLPRLVRGPRPLVVSLALNVGPALVGAILAFVIAQAGAPPPLTWG